MNVLYHANCNDGFASAFLFCIAYHDREITAVPVRYGEEPPWVYIDGEDIAVVDFSYKSNTMKEVMRRAKSCIVIDHHKSAVNELHGFDNCILDIRHSGASLCFSYLENDLKYALPRRELNNLKDLVFYVEDRDLWKWQLPFTDELTMYLRSLPHEAISWGHLIEENILCYKNEGKAIKRWYDMQVDNFYDEWLENKEVFYIGEHTCPCINAPGFFSSDVAGRLSSISGVSDIGCCYYRYSGAWVYSLRSRKDLDVSAIAEQYGGGGHKNAAGFRLQQLMEIGVYENRA